MTRQICEQNMYITIHLVFSIFTTSIYEDVELRDDQGLAGLGRQLDQMEPSHAGHQLFQ